MVIKGPVSNADRKLSLTCPSCRKQYSNYFLNWSTRRGVGAPIAGIGLKSNRR